MRNPILVISLLLVLIGLVVIGMSLTAPGLDLDVPVYPDQVVESVANTDSCPASGCLKRYGIGVAGGDGLEPVDVIAGLEAGLPFGVYYDWLLNSDPLLTGDLEYWQMIRVTPEGPAVPYDFISSIIAERPGSVWLIGNEPDNIYQDNVTAERYAEIYHDLYSFIKARDRFAAVAIAGVSQPTPLRMAYLDRVLETYQELFGQPMPIDIWTIHAYIFREEAGTWGAEIPPGFEDSAGELYDIDDHADINIFMDNLLQFREWMSRRGYGDKPLAVTEFGILLPEDFGFSDDKVAQFMRDTYDFLSSASGENGWAKDDYRLFQWWFWYSYYDIYNFPRGDLYDPVARELTPLGQAMRAHVQGAP